MKDYIYTILFAALLIFVGVFFHQKKELKKYKELYSIELQNIEAYQLTNSNLNSSIRQYQMSINDLRASKDSIDKKLVEVIDELKIKNSKIEYLQYQNIIINKVDTITFKDTLFVEGIHIDTVLNDKWYQFKLKLNYPSEIIVSPTFNSEQYVIINQKKEYNNKPSKIFFIRWFQKKHYIVEVNVEERSPYIINKQNKFIKVLK